MTPTTITISGEGMGIIERLRAGMESRELIDLFGLKFAGVKLEVYTHGDPHAVMLADEVTEDRSAPWSGDGLPPVGTECEIAASTEYLKISYPEGAKVKIYAHFKHDTGRELAAFVDQNCQVYGIGMAKIFAPIKTPAQIAAEKRETAIARMKECFDSVSDDLCPTSNQYLETLFGALHDAGYRLTKGEDQ